MQRSTFSYDFTNFIIHLNCLYKRPVKHMICCWDEYVMIISRIDTFKTLEITILLMLRYVYVSGFHEGSVCVLSLLCVACWIFYDELLRIIAWRYTFRLIFFNNYLDLNSIQTAKILSTLFGLEKTLNISSRGILKGLSLRKALLKATYCSVRI